MIKFSVSVHIINMHSCSHIHSVILEIIIKRLISLGEHNFSPMQSSRLARSLNRISHHLKPNSSSCLPRRWHFLLSFSWLKPQDLHFCYSRETPPCPRPFLRISEREVRGKLQGPCSDEPSLQSPVCISMKPYLAADSFSFKSQLLLRGLSTYCYAKKLK